MPEDVPQEGGCGCVAAGATPTGATNWRAVLLAVLALGVVFIARRRF